MSKYFLKNEYCKIVKGFNGSLLYNLKDGRVFSFDIQHSDILKDISENTSINELKTKHIKIDIDSFLVKLKNNNIGYFSDASYYIEDYRQGKLITLESENPPIMSTCFIELPIGCDKYCEHCNKNKYQVCETCGLPNITDEEIDFNFYNSLFNQLAKLNFKKYIVHGGNPFLLNEKLIEFLELFRKNVGYNSNIFIKSNPSLFNKFIPHLIKMNIHPILVFDASKSNINNLFLELYKLKDNILDLNNNLKINVNLVVDNFSKKYIPQLIETFKTHGINNISISFIIEENIYPKELLNLKNQYVPDNGFEEFITYNHCLNGNIAITCDGDIIPCPGLKDEVVSNLKLKTLLSSFEGNKNIGEYWKFTADNISSCRQCKYKYSCADCRAVEKRLSNGDICGKTLCELIK
ncbi:radical SAM additional 4Fe4S-binding SPASM domain-containing protein [Clostridium collagenovorans DSM 3089]|uniref:Radical SAM additional 4Fe4S-binding SPASM domain-containing protein n=1 Tax=Clostridium collagenovorans DSM 3089 TaxID=1121306 RepID=A0A1M5X4P3_9CLOT|nr:hypothetical protein [Clostridium collagenovorans]SHH94776.1 radical SAM additional 4Fe4S-binding SPASM domain-containing protein [Clostridium collagenovorans DSM 3089]